MDSDLNVGGDNTAGGLADGYLKFVNIGRLLKMKKDSLSMRVGRFELDLPFSQARNINISGYDIFDQANLGNVNPAFAQKNVTNQLTMADAMNGIEFSGGHPYGGYHYSIAFIDQNTSGLFCDEHRSFRAIHEMLTREVKPDLTTEDCRIKLQQLVDTGLMFREEDRYLALAVPKRSLSFGY